jgi:hypothetical protein
VWWSGTCLKKCAIQPHLNVSASVSMYSRSC